MFNAPDDSSLILMLAVGPPMVEIALMFIVRPISGGHKQVRPSDNTSFYLIYAFCISLAAYLLAVAVLDDTVDVNQTVNTLIAVILILTAIIPVVLVFCSTSKYPIEESLLDKPNKQADDEDGEEAFLSEVEDEKTPELDSLPASERSKRIAHLKSKMIQAAAQGAVRVKRREGPRRGEDFTLFQALKKADFLLLFLSFLLAAGDWYDSY
ncbi:hypothetical protein Dsin_030431 [Dipteronia sinensis]|uniref:Nodulin-like domain-containing protein n=1 Tax=Dipteronia sinensis TaxID=43782 RepID=A0AAD9ZJK7_9ROSI|nr:hypothetical protein Dsin_030431 [Dipteronia sinensis]